MLVVELVLAVCMTADPRICRDERLSFESHGSLSQCMFEAMPAIAQWSGQHPQWQVNDFHCEWPGGRARET